MLRSPRLEKHGVAGGPWSPVVFALLVVLYKVQEQDFFSSRASRGCHRSTFRRQTASRLAFCSSSRIGIDEHGVPGRRAQLREMGEGWAKALFGRGGHDKRSYSRSELQMANLEDTQQLRDSDVDFMFDGEAQV